MITQPKGISVAPSNMLGEMESLANMSMLSAYRWGVDKNKYAEDDWVHCSPRTYLRGLKGTLDSASKRTKAGSLSKLTKALGWHWLAKCQSIPVFTRCAEQFAIIQHLVSTTVHSDLDDRVKHADKFSFSNTESWGDKGRTSLYFHKEVYGAFVGFSDGIGIDVDDFAQIGMGWSMSTDPEYSARAREYFLPEIEKIILLAERRNREFMEVRLILKFRELYDDGKLQDTLTVNGFEVQKLTP